MIYEFDDGKAALAFADEMTKQHGCKYTVTGAVNALFAVRRQTPWELAFLNWRRAFYREYGMVP